MGCKPGGAEIEWVHSTAQDFRSDKRFDLIIMTGHAFQVFLSDKDVREVLRTLRDHIAPGGTIAFESRNPNVDWAAKWSARPERTWDLGPGENVSISTAILESSADFISFKHSYRFPNEVLTSSSTLRFTGLSDLAGFLAEAGFGIEACHGDWDLSPFAPETSPEMIFVAKPAAGDFA